MADRFDLDRFIKAQEPVTEQVRAELATGDKRTHWMWFVFPQLAGLGRSSMAQRYAISSLEEAGVYLRHPVLGPRLTGCSRTVLGVKDRSAHDIFGSPDELKFRSCLTLFAQVPDTDPAFAAALLRYFNGKADEATLRLLRERGEGAP